MSKISTSKVSGIELKKPTWTHLQTFGKFNIEKLFVDDIMFGPTYYKFQAKPHIPAFDQVFFGDFIYPCFGGVLLQRWNYTTIKDLPDFTLVFLDGQNGTLFEIQRIKSFSWKATEVDEDTITVKWFNGIEGGEVIVNRAMLFNTSQNS